MSISHKIFLCNLCMWYSRSYTKMAQYVYQKVTSNNLGAGLARGAHWETVIRRAWFFIFLNYIPCKVPQSRTTPMTRRGEIV